MCGIVGYIGNKRVVPVLLEGLRRLEYRGYDSAGIAVVDGSELKIRRSAGKLRDLEEVLRTSPVDGRFGVGQTCWANTGRRTGGKAHSHEACHRDTASCRTTPQSTTTWRSRTACRRRGTASSPRPTPR